MSAKVKKEASEKKSPAKAVVEKKVGKAADKKSKASASVIEEEIEISAAPVVAEEEEEEEELSRHSGGGGSAAALAAASASPTEGPGSLKNFRHHPDMENFYRFIYENDLRLEALQILDEMMEQRALSKNVKAAKANAH